jgi:adenine-specific DNA-methyltransferase
MKYRQIYKQKSIGGGGAEGYNMVELPDGVRRRMTTEEQANPSRLPAGGKVSTLDNLTSPRVREARTGYYPIKFNGEDYYPKKGEWKTHRGGIEKLLLARRTGLAGETLRYVRFINDFPAFPLNNFWGDTGVAGFVSDKKYVVETSTKLVERCVLMTTDPGDLVLDPTCGSGTTAGAGRCPTWW